MYMYLPVVIRIPNGIGVTGDAAHTSPPPSSDHGQPPIPADCTRPRAHHSYTPSSSFEFDPKTATFASNLNPQTTRRPCLTRQVLSNQWIVPPFHAPFVLRSSRLLPMQTLRAFPFLNDRLVAKRYSSLFLGVISQVLASSEPSSLKHSLKLI